MKRIIIGLLTLVLGFSKPSCNNQPEEQSKSESKVEKLKNNPLLKELKKVISGSGFDSIDRGIEFIDSKVEEVYKRMNAALAKKDLPGFVRAYREAVTFEKQLMEIGPCYSGSYWSYLFYDRTEGLFGKTYTRIMTNPEILDNWSINCGDVNQKAKTLAEGLYNFDRNRRLSLGDIVDDKNGNGHQIWHNDLDLLMVRSKDLHANATTVGEGVYFRDATYTNMHFSKQADIMTYNLITNTHSENRLESTTYRECSFIDMGMDGIDACDARLNGIKKTDIPATNEKAIACMNKTTEVLRRRYAGTGFIE